MAVISLDLESVACCARQLPLKGDPKFEDGIRYTIHEEN